MEDGKMNGRIYGNEREIKKGNHGLKGACDGDCRFVKEEGNVTERIRFVCLAEGDGDGSANSAFRFPSPPVVSLCHGL